MSKNNIIKTVIISTVYALTLSASTTDISHKYDEVYKLHKVEGSDAVMKKYKKLCDKREMRSCRNLGIISYKRGWKTIGRRLLKRSCIGGVAGACHYLGFLYEKLGYSKSSKTYYTLACSKGHPGGCLAIK